MKNSIATIAPHYTMKRQLDDYYDKFYNKEAARFKKLAANDNALAKEIALWKESVAERWDGIHVVSKNDCMANGVETGQKYKVQYVIDEQGLNDAVGLELVVLNDQLEDGKQVYAVYPFKVHHRQERHRPQRSRTGSPRRERKVLLACMPSAKGCGGQSPT